MKITSDLYLTLFENSSQILKETKSFLQNNSEIFEISENDDSFSLESKEKYELVYGDGRHSDKYFSYLMITISKHTYTDFSFPVDLCVVISPVFYNLKSPSGLIRIYPLVDEIKESRMLKLNSWDENHNLITYLEKYTHIPISTRVSDSLKSFLNNFEIFLKNIISNYSKTLYEVELRLNERLNKFNTNENKEFVLVGSDSSLIKLLTKHQSKIIEIDKSYIQKFIKLSNYIKTKNENINLFWTEVNKSTSVHEKNHLLDSLENQIHTYEIIFFHSLNMVVSLVESDLITFYQIYETFDKLNIFNSNWENETKSELVNIGNKIDSLIDSIKKMETSITKELRILNYYTQESFKELQNSVVKELGSINSSVKFNNLLTGIQTFLM